MKLFRVLFFVASGSYPIDVVTKILVKLFSKSSSVQSPSVQVWEYFYFSKCCRPMLFGMILLALMLKNVFEILFRLL